MAAAVTKRQPASRKTVSAVITMAFILCTMICATLLKTPDGLAENALWMIGLTGGVTVGGQAWVDRVAGSKRKVLAK